MILLDLCLIFIQLRALHIFLTLFNVRFSESLNESKGIKTVFLIAHRIHKDDLYIHPKKTPSKTEKNIELKISVDEKNFI